MKKYLLLFLPLLFTGCYTSLNTSYYTQRPETVSAINQYGDTLKVYTYNFYTQYNKTPQYYNGWKLYWDGRWIPSYEYYRYYTYPFYLLPPTNQVVIYKNTYKSTYTPQSVLSKPRSTGTSTQRTKSKDPDQRSRNTSRTGTTERKRNN